MKNVIKLLAIGTLGLTGQQAQAINIDFNYTYDSNNFFDTQAKKYVLEAAGSYFEGRINDSLSAITSSGSNQFNAIFSDPGGTGASVTVNDFSVAADTLVVYAGGRNISGSAIGVGGPGGYSLSGTPTFLDSSVSRGQGDGSQAVTQGASAYDFAPWGGSISFDTDAATTWYFDDDVSTNESFAGSNDFYSVALHELAHLLGFGIADSWDNKVSGGFFTGTNSGTVALAPGGSHWANGTMSVVDTISQETAMDPSITVGTRKYFTNLDSNGLRDIGWEVSAVPVPAAVYFFGSGLLGLAAFRKKVK